MSPISVVLISICIIIICSYKKWVHIVPMSIAVALLIGAIAQGLGIKEILAFLPLSTMYDVFILTFFFGFAVENGTFEALVNRALYHTGRCGWLLMPLLYAISVLIALIGPGVMAAAFMAPFAYHIAEKIKSSTFLAYATTALGCIFGSNFPRSAGGAAVYRMIESGEYGSSAMKITMQGFLWTGAVTTIVFIVIYLVCRGWRCEKFDQKETAPMLPIQIKTTLLIAIILLISLLPHVIKAVIEFSWLEQNMGLFDSGLIMAVGCCFASVLKLGSERVIMRECVPWSTILTIGGMGMLIGVGKSVGMVDAITLWMNQSIPAIMIVPFLAVVGGLMSVFTSAIGVVIPTLFALVPQLSITYGISPSALYIAPFIAATLTGSSPLSTTGGMTLGGCPNEANRESLFYRSMLLPFVLLIIVAVISFFLP